MRKKGFTLIELLIVIGILAVLATITVLVLNPAQLFAQGRDSQRISDLSTTRSALSLYLATVTSPDLDGATTACSSRCYVNLASGLATGCGSRHGTKTVNYDTDRTVDGTGWIPVDFSSISSGAPLSNLPVDPTNDTTNFYSYACDNTNKTFELNADMESLRYAQGGEDSVEDSDGGNSATIYEVGSEPGLDI